MLREVKLLGDASKNCLVWVRGYALPGDDLGIFEILDLDNLSSSAQGNRPQKLILSSALWTLQEKMGLRLWMSEDKYPSDLLLLMESRNFMRFDRGITLEDWKGKLYIEPFNITDKRWFWFQLDFDKAFKK